MSKNHARFWDRIADRYARKPVADEASYQKKLEISRRYFRPDTTLLELGCGTGSTAIAHAPHVNKVHATDISARMIEIGQEKADRAGLVNISFEQASVESLDLASESVDVVLGLSLLHLLEDREAAIAKVHEMLKPGGYFISSTACLGSRMAWFRWIAPIGRKLGLIPLVRVFSFEQLTSSLTEAGFEIEYEWRPEQGVTLFAVARKAVQHPFGEVGQ